MDVDEADMEEEDDEVMEEEEEEEGVDEEEVDEEEEEAIEDKDQEYEFPIDSGPYQTSDYLDSLYFNKNQKPTTSAPLKEDSCECFRFFGRLYVVPEDENNNSYARAVYALTLTQIAFSEELLFFWGVVFISSLASHKSTLTTYLNKCLCVTVSG